MSEVRVRIAPSPTGFLHVGTARTAVYNWLFARNQGGKFILRIEDTDVARSSEEMVRVILDSLSWLGLNWDEGPYYQSQRNELYRKYAYLLLEKKKAYYCYCSPEELKIRREEAQRQKIAWKYDRKCLKRSTEEIAELERKGALKAIRLLVPEGNTSYRDLVYGELSIENKNIDDLVLLRSDGTPTYNLACVVDDVEMKITHVIRGNDHIANTYKQILIYQALDKGAPHFAHLPLILGMDRAKISKRFQAVSVTDYREQGFLPEAVVNFLALLGWSPKDEKEILSQAELIQRFSLEDVHQANPVFDIQKLEWMNGEYIRQKSEEELYQIVKPFILSADLLSDTEYALQKERVQKILALLKERCRRLNDFAENGGYFFKSVFDYDQKGVQKLFRPEAAERLLAVKEEYENLDGFSKEETEATLRMLAESLHVKPADLIHPVRLALTGITMGPALFDIVELLGKEEVVKRLERAAEFIKRGTTVN
jgi:glutamyl-tRNA synthetase